MPDYRPLLLAVGLVAASMFPGQAGAAARGGARDGEGDNKPRTDLYGDPLPEGAIARFGTIRLQHSGAIRCVAYSPDGTVLASSGADYVTRLWDPTSGKLLHQYKQYSDALAFSPDSKTLATFAAGQITLLDVATGKPGHVLKPALAEGLHSLVFTADGQTLATATTLERGEVVELSRWDVQTGALRGNVRLPKGLNRGVLAADSQAAGKAVFFTFADTVITSWSPETGKPQREFRGHTKAVVCLAASASGQTLASFALDGSIRLWDAAAGKQAHTWPCAVYPCQLVFSTDGRRLAGMPTTGELPVWDVATGTELVKIKDFKTACCAALTPKRLAIGVQNAVRTWDIVKGKAIPEAPGHSHAVRSVAFSPDSKTLASGGDEGAVYLWPRLDGAKPQLLADDLGHVYEVLFAPGRRLVAARSAMGIALWDVGTGKLVGKRQSTGYAAFLPDGKTLLIAGYWSLEWWLFDTDKARTYDEPPDFADLLSGFFHTTTLSPDGKTLIQLAGTHSGNRIMAVRDALSGKYQPPLLIDDKELLGFNRVLFAPDGATMILVSPPEAPRGHRVLLFDVATSKVLRSSAKLGNHHPTCTALSPSGHLLAVGHDDGSVTLVEAATAAVCLRFGGHSGEINEIAFSPDGKLLATASEDGTILLWDMDRLSLPKGGASALSEKQLAKLWNDLGSPDAAVAYQATIQLRRDPAKSSTFLVQQLSELWKHDPKQVRQLIANLDDKTYAVREKAQAELLRLEDIAAPAVHEALKNKPSLELRRRLEVLLSKLNPATLSSRQLSVWRAMAILELAAGAEGLAWLEQVAGGAPEAWLARNARLALDRIKKRAVPTDLSKRLRFRRAATASTLYLAPQQPVAYENV
jgi:WD40 repeat protein